MNEVKLSTKLEYPQISDVFKTWKKINTWGKKRTIYENEKENFKVMICLNQIDCARNKLEFKIFIPYEDDCDWNKEDSCLSVPIRTDYTQKMFENEIYRIVFELIERLEKDEIIESSYAENLYKKYRESLEKLVFVYHNSKVLKENRLTKLSDVTENLISFYAGYNGELYDDKELLIEEYEDYIESQKYVFWADVYKHFISLIPYEEVREKYGEKIKEHRTKYEKEN